MKLIRRRLLALPALAKALCGEGRLEEPEEAEFGVLMVVELEEEVG